MKSKKTTFNLEKLSDPQTIAVVGASNVQGKVGYAIVKNLIEAKFAGEIIPINLHEEKVHGIQAYKSI